MSGFIHITEKTPPWVPVLRGACVVAGALTLVWYALSDEGLPIAPPDGHGTPFVKPSPLPGPNLGTRHTAGGDADNALARRDPAPTRPNETPSPAIDEDSDDYLARNAAIDTRHLSLARPVTARTFLSEVLIAPHPQAGFVVTDVLPDSRFERMGLRPGDVLYTLDTPGVPAVDESSMVALMQQTDVSLEVYRQGTLTRLHTNLATVENGDALPR